MFAASLECNHNHHDAGDDSTNAESADASLHAKARALAFVLFSF